MRLPRRGDDIDLEQVKEMVDLFLDAGFTYFDTAWAYPGSEDAIRQALVERYPARALSAGHQKRGLDQLQNAGGRRRPVRNLPAPDRRGLFRLLPAAQSGRGPDPLFRRLRPVGLGPGAEARRADPPRRLFLPLHARRAGRAPHRPPGGGIRAAPDQLCRLGEPAVQSRACYEVARRHGKPVIVMEPVKGGMLATPPQSVADDLCARPSRRPPPASWAHALRRRSAGRHHGPLRHEQHGADAGQPLAPCASFPASRQAQRETIRRARRRWLRSR
jgi:hypothetical protein